MTAPRVLAPDFDAVPAALRERRQWVLWRLEHKPGAKKPTKVPYHPGGGMASSVDHSTWRPFDDVRAAYEAGGYAGVGYVFSPDDPFVGIDLDGCRNAETGELAPWAQTALDRFSTYAEVSPSGTGIHIIMEGALPPGGRKRGPVECYDEGRYFTVTGRSPDGVPVRPIEERWEVLAAWHAEAFPPKAASARAATKEQQAAAEPDDERLLERARKAKNGKKFRALFDDGDVSAYGSHSEADLGLCVLLAYWTKCDAARVDRLFRRSSLLRPKWDQGAGQGETYGQRTVRTAIERSTPAASVPSGELCTDLGNARRLVLLHGKDLRHTGALGWLVWDGRRWRRDDSGESERRAKDAVRAILCEVRKLKDTGDAAGAEYLWKWAVKSQGAARIEALLKLARTEPEIAARGEDFDRDAWLLNVLNGTLDLRTGELRPHRREDLLTKLIPVPYEPEAEAPRWRRFLEQVQPDPEARGFLARYAGYCLTGDMGEQVFAVHHGGGSNGKGVYSDTLLALLGDYAGVTPYATFVQRRPDAPTNDLAALRGARLVVASEPNEGVRLDEGAVKSITGEDPISARFHYQEFFTFRPTCKLILTGNHRPRIRGTDHAMWRRVLLVPWPVTVSKPDKDLRRRLRDELPGILRWAVEGCLVWQREGLRPPAAVRAAVDEYREAEDHVGRFIADRCRLGSELVVTAKELRAAYVAWVEEEGEEPMSAKALGARLTDRGIRAIRNESGVTGRGWKGITLWTHGRMDAYPEKVPHARARAGEDFSQRSAEASNASTQDPDAAYEAAEREAVRGEANGEFRWPMCPICSRTDRPAGSAAGCRVCREYLEATGAGPGGDRDRGVL
jgi:putative DNA primase/helicase